MAKKDYTATREDYMTPAAIYEPILKMLKLDTFSMDVCCSEANIPAIKHIFNGVYDGLEEKWAGYCFLNPPFKQTQKWVRKALLSVNGRTCVIAVLPADRLETKYYQECILKNRRCMFAFLPGKVGFINPDNPNEAPIPSQKIMIVIFDLFPEAAARRWNQEKLFNTVAFVGGEY